MEDKSLDIIFEKLPDRIRVPLTLSRAAYENSVNEIVLRADKPICVYTRDRMYFVTDRGFLTDVPKADGLLLACAEDIGTTVLRLCDYSVYAYQNEINSGFITIGGGVRVGLCGRAVMKNDSIVNIRDISTLSFRVSRDIRGCSEALVKKLNPLDGVLICGEPCSGKTTLVRDMARALSYRYRVSVLDERGELSAYRSGCSGFDLGFCDIYAGYPKGVAANCAVRSMAPDIIVCDEMGDRDDAEMLMYSMRCGAAFIASVHASSMDDLRSRDITKEIINTGAFRYIVFLYGRDDAGRIGRIYEMSDVGR